MSHDHHAHTPEVLDPADSWHKHTADEHPQQAHAENIDTTMVLSYGVAAFLIIVVSVVLTIVYFNWYATRLEIARQEQIDGIQGPYWEKRKTVEDVDFKQYGWVDPAANVIRIPLASAMDKVVASYAAKQK